MKETQMDELRKRAGEIAERAVMDLEVEEATVRAPSSVRATALLENLTILTERLAELMVADEQVISRSKMEISYLRGKLRRQTNWEEYEKLIEGFHATLANVPKHLGGYK